MRIVKKIDTIDIHQLIEAMEMEDMSDHEVFEELCSLSAFYGQKTYMTIGDDTLADRDLCEQAAEYLGDSVEYLSDEDILNHSTPETNSQKVKYRLLQMMVNGDISKEFMLLIWW